MDRSTSRPTTCKSHNTAAQSHPDAALLRLMSEHVKAQARVEAAEVALEVAPASMPDRAFDRLCAKVSGIEDAILAQLSRTPEGLGIKARIAARYMQAPEDWGLRTYEVLGRFVQEIAHLTDRATSGRV